MLQVRQVLELADLTLQARGHGVEARREARDVVLSAHRHAFVEVAGGEALGDVRGGADGRHDEARREVGAGAEEQDEREAAGGERGAHDAERVGFLVHREDEVQVVRAGVGDADA